MPSDDLVYKIAFASVKGMSLALANDLMQHLESEKDFFTTSEAHLFNITQSSSRIYSKAYRDAMLHDAAAELDFIITHKISVLYYTDARYPQRLLECDDAPLILYCIGNTDLNNARIISVVGTRRSTIYGMDFTDKLVHELAETVDNPIIVSGLAYGIDITAHKAAIKYGIPTMAVLAHGLNMIYPSDHRSDAINIVKQGGMLISDYKSSDKMHRGSFLARNRIIAGLADCTVVVESARKGGALATAGIASAYGRDVFALPGRISDKYSTGCNHLIASNIAAIITEPSDLAAAMRWPVHDKSQATPTLPITVTDEEGSILDFIRKNESATTNRISVSLNIPIGKLLSTMIDLEFRGLLAAVPGGRYRLL